ncbi:MAG: pilin [Candidatus Saccharimonas sp.]
MKISIKKSLQLLLAAPMLVLGLSFLVAPAVYAVDCDSTDLSLTKSAECAKSTSQPDSLFGNGGVFQKVTDVLLFVIGAVSVIMLIIGGIRYTISQGDSNAITTAKNTILYAIIGLVVAILAYAAVHFVIGSFANKE